MSATAACGSDYKPFSLSVGLKDKCSVLRSRPLSCVRFPAADEVDKTCTVTVLRYPDRFCVSMRHAGCSRRVLAPFNAQTIEVPTSEEQCRRKQPPTTTILVNVMYVLFYPMPVCILQGKCTYMRHEARVHKERDGVANLC